MLYCMYNIALDFCQENIFGSLFEYNIINFGVYYERKSKKYLKISFRS